MSEISPTTTTGTTGTGSPPTSTLAASGLSEDFDTFLQLLTAQIRNQDPLAPLDSTQFVEQLATFSSLEQQVETNNTLTSIASMIGDLHAALATEWLGQEVAVTSKHVAYDGGEVEFEISPSYSYDEAVLTVSNSNNQIVWQEALDASKERHSWNGSVQDPSLSGGNGVYQFQVDLFSQGQLVARTDPEIVSKITTLANDNGQLKLGTDNYLTTDLNSVRKLASN